MRILKRVIRGIKDIFRKHWNGTCFQRAAYCAMVAQHNTKCQVRMAHGALAGICHVEAQGLIDGDWVYLRMTWLNRVVKSEEPRGFVVQHYYAPGMYMQLYSDFWRCNP